MGLSSRRWTHVVWMGVYRRDVIVKNNIKFIAGLHHQDIVWTTEFMFNALRARYTEQSLYKYYLHNTSVSRLHRQGNKNLNYQRHYIKITRLLEKLNRNYADKITIYPEFHQQITYEALRVCHAVRKVPDILTRQRMIAEIFTSGMYKRLITNVRSVKVGYRRYCGLSAYGNGATKRGRTIALRVAPLICASVKLRRFGLFAQPCH